MSGIMSEKDLRWNRFIREVCFREPDTLSQIQKNAVLCFWYDAEMNSGGLSGYFEVYPDTVPQELIDAILAVGTEEMADNYRQALIDGENDDYEQADSGYDAFSPSLCECLQDYVERYRDVMFDE